MKTTKNLHPRKGKNPRVGNRPRPVVVSKVRISFLPFCSVEWFYKNVFFDFSIRKAVSELCLVKSGSTAPGSSWIYFWRSVLTWISKDVLPFEMIMIILTIRNTIRHTRRNHKRVRMHHRKWMSVRILCLIWIMNIGREWCEWDSSHENKPVSWTEVLYRRLFFLMLYTVLITNMYYIFEIILLARVSYIYLCMNKVSSFKPPRWTQAIFLMIFIVELSWWPLKNWYLLLFIRSKMSNQVRSSSLETFLVCHICHNTNSKWRKKQCMSHHTWNIQYVLRIRFWVTVREYDYTN